MSGCCSNEHNFTGISTRYKRALLWVIAINGLMFFIELSAGISGQSQALQADALDFLGDTFTYAISLWAIGKSLTLRSNVALFKGYSLFAMALWVFASTLYRCFILNDPNAYTMGSIAFLAFTANLVSLLLLMKFKDGDANVRSVWLCSRNDAIGNVIVLIAASTVWFTDNALPDLAVAFILASLFLSSSVQIIKQARLEKKIQSLNRNSK